jgi:protein-L-isoaspartate(D-aspartate) O-methyltransferase
VIDLAARRRFFAEEVCAVAGVHDDALVDALAVVPREQFLGPGPWSVVVIDALPSGTPYRQTPDADPKWLYHNQLVAIDPDRQLNNGHPSSLALWISSLTLKPGERVVHVGCGVGYYTAILAELVGPTGSVTAFEVDPGLAQRARTNLASRPWVEVVEGDGAAVPPLFDALFVNAGCTHPRPEWLDGLAGGGRLLIPLTARVTPQHSSGVLVRVVREPAGFTAGITSRISIFDCVGARDPDESEAILAMMKAAAATATLPPMKSLVRAPHEPGPDCVLHTSRYCLSSAR